jgi:hypothetical protein
MWNYVSVENPNDSLLQRELSKKIGEILTLSISKMRTPAQFSYHAVYEKVIVLLLEVDVYDASFAGKWPQLCRGPVPCYDLAEISWTDSTYNDRVIIKALFKGEPSYMRIERRNITSYPQLDFVIKMKSSSQ